jgi:enoyl-CoA hydratase/carnithine racemase
VSDQQPMDVDRHGRVVTLTLDRPIVLNALSPALVDALIAAVQSVATDPSVGAVILAGAGRSFCAGGDLTAMLAMDRDRFRGYIERLQELSRSMHVLPIPTIAALHGHVLAGGFELAIECDLRIATPDTTFGLPDTALGLSPTSGMSWLLPRIVGEGWARDLLLTGRTIDVATAERIGLVTRVVAAADLEPVALEMATAIAAQPPAGLRLIREEMAAAAEGSFDAALRREVDAEVACFATPDFQANLRAFANRRRREA